MSDNAFQNVTSYRDFYEKHNKALQDFIDVTDQISEVSPEQVQNQEDYMHFYSMHVHHLYSISDTFWSIMDNCNKVNKDICLSMTPVYLPIIQHIQDTTNSIKNTALDIINIMYHCSPSDYHNGAITIHCTVHVFYKSIVLPNVKYIKEMNDVFYNGYKNRIIKNHLI